MRRFFNWKELVGQNFSDLQIIFLFFYKKIICERHLSRSSGLDALIESEEKRMESGIDKTDYN